MGLPETLLGRIIDCDSHEMVPIRLWGQEFGEVGDMLAPFVQARVTELGDNSLNTEFDDVMDITDETVWTAKGCSAPGAFDLQRRPQVLDVMGIQHQFVFATFGLVGLSVSLADEVVLQQVFGLDAAAAVDMDQVHEIGHAALRAYNDWVIRQTKVDLDRVRPAGLLLTNSLDEMLAETQRLADADVRAVWIPVSIRPGGISPENLALDPFWTLLEENDMTVVAHIGGGEAFFVREPWGQSFVPGVGSFEAPALTPFYMSNLHLPVWNFLSALVLGGVFERHPRLRFGAIELGASWAGPLAESLDMWVEDVFHQGDRLPLRPSEYLARNVRVTPFWQEPVDTMLERYPHLVDMYCYGSDYPHVEGGKHSAQRIYDKIVRLGDETVEKFFVTNGQCLIPPAQVSVNRAG